MSTQSITAQANHVHWTFTNGAEYKANRMSFRHLNGNWYLQAYADINSDSRAMILLVIYAPDDRPFFGSLVLAPFTEPNNAGWMNVYEEVAPNVSDTCLTEGQANVQISPNGVSTGDFTVHVRGLDLELKGSFSITPDAPYAEFTQAPSNTHGKRSSALAQPS